MLHFTQGNLLEANAEALVNTVNTVGIMGKGIASMFKEAYPKTSGSTPLLASAARSSSGACLSPSAPL